MADTTSPTQGQPLKPPIKGTDAYLILSDGTVLYKSWQQAEQARAQQAASRSKTVASLSQAHLGEPYRAKDGTTVPYGLSGLVEFQFTGLIVVMLVLGGLSLICVMVARLLRAVAAPVTDMQQPHAPAAIAAVTPGLHPLMSDQELIVVLTAAAVEALGTPVRVERFKPLDAKDLGWTTQGRADLLHSHRLK